MGCCSSSTVPVQTDGLEQPVQNPKEKGGSDKNKPGKLAVPAGKGDPNAANATPHANFSSTGGFAANNQDCANIIQPVNKTTTKNTGVQEPVKMFIPWEQPALGANGRPKRHSAPDLNKGSKPRKKKNRDLHKTKDASALTFIPGSGSERILMAGENSRPSSTASTGRVHLKPIKAIKASARADGDTIAAIAEARKAHKERKDMVRAVNSSMVAGGMTDIDVKRLIRQYAGIGREESEEVHTIAGATSEHKTSSSRTQIKCPTKAGAP